VLIANGNYTVDWNSRQREYEGMNQIRENPKSAATITFD
jgi:hypothetical protein